MSLISYALTDSKRLRAAYDSVRARKTNPIGLGKCKQKPPGN